MKKRVFLLLMLVCLLWTTIALGEIGITLSKDTAAIGEFIHIEVEQPENAVSLTYTMTQNGRAYFETENATRFSGEFCPRRAGTYVLKVKVRKSDRTSDSGTVTFTVTEDTVDPDHTDSLSPATRFDQKDGWWKGFSYGTGTLNKSGCAIFTLSHALMRLGYTDPSVLPPALAVRYAKCHIKGGTSNSLLINTAATHYGFLTRDDAIDNPWQIRRLLEDGCKFSFSIVLGHIALVDGIAEDGQHVHIVDSAPEATLTRIKKGAMYLTDEDGKYQTITDLAQVPGMIWYPDTGSWSSLEYWMDLSYAARRTVRLIQPYWVTYRDANGTETPVDLLTLEPENSVIKVQGEKQTVPTGNLTWEHEGEELRLAKVVSKKSVVWLAEEGNDKAAKVKPGTLLPVIHEGKDLIEVRYKNLHYLLKRSDAELISLQSTNEGV